MSFFAIRASIATVRRFHSCPRACHFVGPPDPISNLRPVLYTDLQPAPPARTPHPYSLSEFTGDPMTGDLDLQYKLHRQRLDEFDHDYWTDSNTRFEAAKQSILDSLPESSSPQDREMALSEFYKMWVLQESQRQDEYSKKWRRGNFKGIALAAAVEYRRLKSRLSER